MRRAVRAPSDEPVSAKTTPSAESLRGIQPSSRNFVKAVDVPIAELTLLVPIAT